MFPVITPSGFPWVSSVFERFTDIMNPKTSIRTVKFKKANIVPGIAPGVVLGETIRTAIGINGKILTQNVGLIAAAISLGLDDPSIQAAISEIRGTEQAKQVDKAVAYLARVGIGISPVGRAWGIIFNAAYAIGAPKILDKEQREIFGDSPTTAIISTDGLLTLLTAATLTSIQINSEGSTRKTAAELMREQFGGIGSVETNAFNTSIGSAIDNKLTAQTLAKTLESMLRQNADIASLPQGIVESLGKVGFSGRNVPPAIA